MDFNFDTTPTNNEQNNKDTNQFNNDGFMNMDFQSVPEKSEAKTALDDMLNMNFQPSTGQESQPKNDMMINMGFNTENVPSSSFSPNVDAEEQKRIEERKKEAEARREKINQKMQKEQELRMEIIKKANEYLKEFEDQRKEAIAKRRKELEAKNTQINENKSGGNNQDSWGRVNSNIDLKDSDYKGSKDVGRMREAMMNRTNDPNSEPLQKFFG